MPNVAENLKRLMEERGLKPKPLARLAGLGETYVYDVLSGKSVSQNVSKLRKLAAAMNVPLFEVTGEEEDPPPSTYDTDVMRKAVVATLGTLKRHGILMDLPLDDVAEDIMAAYADMLDERVGPADGGDAEPKQERDEEQAPQER